MLLILLAIAQGQGPLPADGRIGVPLKLDGGVTTRAVRDGDAALSVTADNVTIDLGGGILTAGNQAATELDKAEGIGILVRGRKNVTIKNAHVRGYRWNIRVEDSSNVRLENCDVSLSRSQRVGAAVQGIDQWLELRNLDTWRTYGAGIWLESSLNSQVVNCRGCSSQNGLLIVDSKGIQAYDNDFSFNSGWGIGLWGSSSCAISWNHLDFVNRPWAGGWGGDSAALAVANGSAANYFVGNSMTHSGDGFFLTDRVNGGYDDRSKSFRFDGASNDNVIAFSDGSYSTANAFEGTFSNRNAYYKNVADHSQYGFWIGFSNDTLLAGNEVVGNVHDGIAGGQGSRTIVEGNSFSSNEIGVDFWSDGGAAGTQAPARDHLVSGNTFEGPKDVRFRDASGWVYRGTGPPEKFGAPTKAAPSPGQNSAFEHSPRFSQLLELVKAKPDGWTMYTQERGPVGQEWLAVGDYAPVDFRSTLAAVRQPDASSIELYLMQEAVRVVAPVGLKYADTRGNPRIVRLYSQSPKDGVGSDFPCRIEITSSNGKKTQLVSTHLTNMVWNMAWYRWDQPKIAYDDTAAWKALFATPPLAKETARGLDNDWSYRSPHEGVPNDHFALVAHTKVRLSEGTYAFDTISDDGIRLYVDGAEVVSRWNHHGATPDHAELPLEAGVHQIRVEYCQEDGAARLLVRWVKR